MSKDYKTASEENTDEESCTIILPSAYAGITRKQNEIIKYYENGSIDITKLEKLQLKIMPRKLRDLKMRVIKRWLKTLLRKKRTIF